MKLTFSSTGKLLKKSFSSWQEDNASVWCAALAYFTVFSIGPLLLLIISIVGFISSKTNFENNIYGQLEALLGKDGANILHTVITHAKTPSTSIIGAIIGSITLILGAAGLFGQLQQMLNMIWGVTQKPKNGIVSFIRSRFLNFSMIGVIAFLLLVSLIASTIIAGVGTYLTNLLPFSGVILESINFVLSFIVTIVLFALIMKVLPDVKLPWKNIWIGAVTTALLFTIGKAVIGIYIGHSGIASEYGAAGSLVILLLWVYYSSQILFFGTELTKEYTLLQGEKIIPNDYSILINTTNNTHENPHKKANEIAKDVGFGFTQGVFSQISYMFQKKKLIK